MWPFEILAQHVKKRQLLTMEMVRETMLLSFGAAGLLFPNRLEMWGVGGHVEIHWT
jgi:hypothetical protein